MSSLYFQSGVRVKWNLSIKTYRIAILSQKLLFTDTKYWNKGLQEKKWTAEKGGSDSGPVKAACLGRSQRNFERRERSSSLEKVRKPHVVAGDELDDGTVTEFYRKMSIKRCSYLLVK